MPKVSIVTRTKERTLLLRRAIASVDAQVFDDWEHIIVNDGGSPGPVDETCALSSKRDDGRRRVIHNQRSNGMEAASNIGLLHANGEFVVIHDDDDSWEPAFLQEAVAYLESLAHDALAAGVITHSVRIRERISGQQVIYIDSSPVNDWLENVTLYRVAANNPYPPISFLYRRSVFEEIGYYREDLPVIGDWEFNLRFISRYEIGVITKPLARYHQRVSLMNGSYSNSVVGGEQTIRRYEARVRNELLRRDLSEGKIGLGFLVNVSKSFEDMHHFMLRNQTAFGYMKDRIWNLGTRIKLIKPKHRRDG